MKNKLLYVLVASLMLIQPCTGQAQSTEKHIISDSSIQDYYEDAVLIGDSVAEGFEYYASITKKSAVHKMAFLVNKGFGADQALKPVEKELNPEYEGEKPYVWDSIARMGAKKVFISYGINDLNPLSKRLVSKHKEVIDNILAQSPEAEINIISITPVVKGGESGRINNDYIREVNAELKQMAEENNWRYIDLFSVLCDEEGNLTASYSYDKFIHLTTRTYTNLWEPVFRDLAAEELAKGNLIEIEEMDSLIQTTQPAVVFAKPDILSGHVDVLPAGKKYQCKGRLANGLFYLDLGDGKDYFIDTYRANVLKKE